MDRDQYTTQMYLKRKGVMGRGVEKDPDSDPTASPLPSSLLFSFFFFAALHCLAGQQKAFKKTGRERMLVSWFQVKLFKEIFSFFSIGSSTHL